MNKNINIKLNLTYCFLLLTFSINAQPIKLNFEPKGQIVEFYFDSLTIYTDTSSLFAIYDQNNMKDYDLRVKNFVRKQIATTNFDTVKFFGNFIPFNDSIDNQSQNWYVQWAILHLMKANRLRILDKHGNLVEIILTKKVGTKRKGIVRRAFINKKTKEELFSQGLFVRTVNPRF